jgi:lysophospholipase L1-like esterase
MPRPNLASLIGAMRGRGAPPPAVVGFGDSITWGSSTANPPATSYIGRAAALLGAGSVNFGLPAAFADRIALDVPRIALDGATVVLNAGTNDAGVAAIGADPERAAETIRAGPASAVDALLAAARAQFPRGRIIVVTVRDLGRARAAYENASPEALTAAARALNEHLRAAAARAGAALLDLESDPQWYIRFEYDNTGIHPNDVGSERLARAVAALAGG